MNDVAVGNLRIGNDLPMTLIAGPCVLENQSHALEMADELKEITARLGLGFIFKSSFDKANRTSIKSKRGVGINEAIRIFADVRDFVEVPILTDVHEPWQCACMAKVVDVLQIPAFLCRQTDLLEAAAATGKVVNVKKGQFLAPHDMGNVLGKLGAAKGKVLFTERGSSFGYNTLINDMRALAIMRKFAPVIFDATHSVQQPGGLGDRSGGQREFVPLLARAAVAAGVAGVFIETHQDPDSAPSDGPNMVPLSEMETLLRRLKQLDDIVKSYIWAHA